MSEFVILAVITAIAVMLLVGWLLHSATRPAETNDDPEEPVVISGPGAHMEIEVMRAKLDAMGVQSYVRNRQGPIMPGGVAPQLWGWEVLVRRRDFGEAEEILFAIEPTDDGE